MAAVFVVALMTFAFCWFIEGQIRADWKRQEKREREDD